MVRGEIFNFVLVLAKVIEKIIQVFAGWVGGFFQGVPQGVSQIQGTPLPGLAKIAADHARLDPGGVGVSVSGSVGVSPLTAVSGSVVSGVVPSGSVIGLPCGRAPTNARRCVVKRAEAIAPRFSRSTMAVLSPASTGQTRYIFTSTDQGGISYRDIDKIGKFIDDLRKKGRNHALVVCAEAVKTASEDNPWTILWRISLKRTPGK